jgi:predicted CoA-binding protein
MTSKASIDDFLAQQTIAIVGVSRNGKKFGNAVLKELKAKEYNVLLINPHAETINGERCYPSLEALPKPVDGAVIVVSTQQAEKVVQDAVKVGVKRVWLQQGSESKTAIQMCEENGISVIHHHCILMFAEPMKFFHRPHKWIWQLIGKYPK